MIINQSALLWQEWEVQTERRQKPTLLQLQGQLQLRRVLNLVHQTSNPALAPLLNLWLPFPYKTFQRDSRRLINISCLLRYNQVLPSGCHEVQVRIATLLLCQKSSHKNVLVLGETPSLREMCPANLLLVRTFWPVLSFSTFYHLLASIFRSQVRRIDIIPFLRRWNGICCRYG